jgi:RimJ/RimL family protein N-acetyltransferase
LWISQRSITHRIEYGGNKLERLATPNDFNSIYEIYMDIENNPFLIFEIMKQELFLPIYEKILYEQNTYVYEIDDQVASTYRIQYKQYKLSHIAYFGRFAMHPAFRGQGFGKEIMKQIISRLKKEGKKRLELFVVSDNTRAISFYKKFGFIEEGRLKYYFKRTDSPDYLDELVMAKYL